VSHMLPETGFAEGCRKPARIIWFGAIAAVGGDATHGPFTANLRKGANVDATLLELVRARLQSEGVELTPWAQLVLAACSSDEALHAVLADKDSKLVPGVASAARSPSVYINAVTVAGFRGVGPKCKLELSGSPGLTLIVGRNGSGKSSLSEALEFVLTGENSRWSTRSKVWKEGWRNLHQTHDAEIEVEMTIEGDPGRAVVSKRWADGAELDQAGTVIQRHGLKKSALADLGWDRPLELYRPFLSYNELGAMFDEGPTAFHDRLSKMLGLEDLVEGQKSLAKERLARTKLIEGSDTGMRLLVAQLADFDDERVRGAIAILKTPRPDLSVLEKMLLGKRDGGDDAVAAALRRLLSIDLPRTEDAKQIADAARQGAEATATAERSSSRALELIELLSRALSFHSQHKEKICPVCGVGALDGKWRAQTAATIERLKDEATAAANASQVASAARAAAREIAQPMPNFVLALRGVLGSADAITAAWRDLAQLDLGSLEVITTKLVPAVDTLRMVLGEAQSEAEREMVRREAPWRRAIGLIAPWVLTARDAENAQMAIGHIKRAEKWLKIAADDIRSERFRPVSEEAKRLWQILRQQSNVDLEVVALAGSGPTRHPVLTVDVDGAETDALSVMSQGELTSIALSLFLPRATLPESPFRFVVIDDPVQSMDPARVDGLARVLASAAQNRQVVVLTHDDRLPEAVRRLNIEATIVSVTRREHSVIELRRELDPVARHLADARALALTTELPPKVAQRVIPGFCRAAIEAACMESVRRRRLGRGDKHSDVESALADQKLMTLAALALFDDAFRGGDVLARLNNSFGAPAADAFKACNRGAHLGFEGDAMALIRSVTALATGLRELK
jgi:recombinational DNA repair ATPase RecF